MMRLILRPPIQLAAERIEREWFDPCLFLERTSVNAHFTARAHSMKCR